jgi:hypothetical protein
MKDKWINIIDSYNGMLHNSASEWTTAIDKTVGRSLKHNFKEKRHKRIYIVWAKSYQMLNQQILYTLS